MTTSVSDDIELIRTRLQWAEGLTWEGARSPEWRSAAEAFERIVALIGSDNDEGP